MGLPGQSSGLGSLTALDLALRPHDPTQPGMLTFSSWVRSATGGDAGSPPEPRLGLAELSLGWR